MVPRLINIPESRSFFLFGPRATGKSTVLDELLVKKKQAFKFDLLNPDLFDEFQLRPQALAEQLDHLPDSMKWVIIDEVQRVPELLNIVHQQIYKKRFLFALTGSSARKLRRGQANLLAGRALLLNLFPLTYVELAEKFNLDYALNFGSLPEVISSEPKTAGSYLRAYVQSYMREEIVAEQIVRKIVPFKSFLKIAAQMNGKIINYSNISRDIGVDHKTVQEYFSILEDTLLGFYLYPFHNSPRKRQVLSPKFYLFDLGVKRAMEGSISQTLQPETSAYGEAFEHHIISEIHRLSSYKELDYTLSYDCSHDGGEIDLIIERPGMPLALVEIKSTRRSVDDVEINKLVKQKSYYGAKAEAYILCLEKRARTSQGVKILPWQAGLKELGL